MDEMKCPLCNNEANPSELEDAWFQYYYPNHWRCTDPECNAVFKDPQELIDEKIR